MTTRSSRLKDVIPLHIFVRKQQVLQMYKDFRRAGREVADDGLRHSIRTQVIYEFHSNKNLTDTVAIKTLMTEARRNLEKLRSMGSSTMPSPSAESEQEEVEDENERQHRIGTGWPWARKAPE